MNTNDLDPEIAHAALLGMVLERMRAELSEDAIKRVVMFALERWGITAAAVYVKTIAPPVVRQIDPPPPPAETAPLARVPINRVECPICGATVKSSVGLNGHMRKHGTTPKEYAARKRAEEHTS